MKTYPLLKNAPPHDSEEFIDYLRENNKVVSETRDWIVVENCKYHTKETPWLTAFYKDTDSFFYYLGALRYLLVEYRDWEWLKKAKSKQTVGRFHIHLIKR